MQALATALIPALFALSITATPALAGGPLHETPGCIRLEPGGTLGVPVRVVDFFGDPIVGEEVRLIIVTYYCDELFYCPGEGLVTTGITDSDGRVELFPRIGGCCSGFGSTGYAVEIEVDPGAVVIDVYRDIGSPDADANGVVDIVDFTLFQDAFLTDDTCFDLKECDEFVSVADFTVFQSRFLSTCP